MLAIIHPISWFRKKLAAKQAAESEARFCEAYKRYQDACRRGDTRGQSMAWPALHEACTARLKAGA